MLNRQMRTLRSRCTEFQTREDGEERIIEGYFAVFNSDYVITPDMSESIAPGAFTSSLDRDVRALTNHDTTLVLGRTTAGTTTLRQDDVGLWARIIVNPNDGDAMNTWARVQRRDVTQCSIGFEIVREETEIRPDGSRHWTILEIKLYEISVCTFPAYEDTNISARSAERDRLMARELAAWKNTMKARINHGT